MAGWSKGDLQEEEVSLATGEGGRDGTGDGRERLWGDERRGVSPERKVCVPATAWEAPRADRLEALSGPTHRELDSRVFSVSLQWTRPEVDNWTCEYLVRVPTDGTC